MIGEHVVYGEVAVSATMARHAKVDARKVEKEFRDNLGDFATAGDVEEWLTEASRDCADDRYSWQTNKGMDRHWRFREEVEREFVEALGGWDGIAAMLPAPKSSEAPADRMCERCGGRG